jgi:hypothetical protein
MSSMYIVPEPIYTFEAIMKLGRQTTVCHADPLLE